MTRRDMIGSTSLTPLLKWPGGKRSLLKHLYPLIPARFNRYYEPFFGGGALFFALPQTRAVLADNNPDLINCYAQVRDHPTEVVSYLREMKNTEEDYYAIRAHVPAEDAAKAARLIYLSTLSFNGIHRVNLKGDFNVPYGYKKYLQPCNQDKINAVSSALRTADLRCDDFEAPLADAQEGDLVYLDPPYTVAHGSNGFVKYNAKIFSWSDQVRLAAVARELVERNCWVLISNADHPSIRTLYSSFETATITRPSVIAAAKQSRRTITECIFFNRK